jgi:hypothetical protein
MPSGEPRQVYNGSSTEYKSLFDDDDGKSSVAPALFFDMSFNSARVRLSLVTAGKRQNTFSYLFYLFYWPQV